MRGKKALRRGEKTFRRNFRPDTGRLSIMRVTTTSGVVGETSRFHFSTIRKNIFLWVEECYGLVTPVGQFHPYRVLHLKHKLSGNPKNPVSDCSPMSGIRDCSSCLTSPSRPSPDERRRTYNRSLYLCCNRDFAIA